MLDELDLLLGLLCSAILPEYAPSPPPPPQAAQDHVTWMEQVEHQITAFVADTSAKRLVLSPMTQAQRGLVHELAQEGYGLATVSTG